MLIEYCFVGFKNTFPCYVGFAAGTARGRGIQTEIVKKKEKKTQRQIAQREREEVNREIMRACHTFQYGSEKSSGVVPRKR